MDALRRKDGKLSRTQVWNSLVIFGTSIFGVAITMLPAIEAIVAHPVFVAIALLIKGVDMYLRELTTQPMLKHKE